MNSTTMANTDPFGILADELQSRNTTEIVIESIIFGFLSLVTIFGNVLTLMAIYRNSKLRTIPNMFVTSLAVSDFGMGVLVMPLSFSVVVTSKWLYGPIVCQIEGWVAIIMAAASTQTLAAMAINRYFGIVKCLVYRTHFTTRRTLYLIALVWILSIVAPAIYMASGNRFVWHPGKLFCYLEINVVWFTALLVIAYVGIPSAIILFCYVRVFQTIGERNKRFKKTQTEDAVSTEEIKVTRTLFVIVLLYMVCWTPVLIIDLVDLLLARFAAPREVYLAYTFLASVSSSVNPVIYGIMSPTFRREFIHSLRVIRCLRKDRTGRSHDQGLSSTPGFQISQMVRTSKFVQNSPPTVSRSSFVQNSPTVSRSNFDVQSRDDISVTTANTRL